MNGKRLAIVLPIIFLLGYFLLSNLIKSEEDKIKERVELILDSSSKSGADGNFGIAVKANKIANNCDSLVTFSFSNISTLLSRYQITTTKDSNSGIIDKNQLKSSFFYGYKRVESIEHSIKDIDITIEDQNRGVVLLTIHSIGRIDEKVLEENQQFRLTFMKKSKGWFLSGVEGSFK